VTPGQTRQDWLGYAVRMAVEEGDDCDLLAMGRPEGQGCYCAANHMLRSIMDGINAGYDYVIMDNEAGMEHLSRRTTRDVDHLLLVSDASLRGLVAAAVHRHLALVEGPLVVLSDSHSPPAEGIRKLRGNLEFANIDGTLRSLFITSALQHEGKTLTVCNLALSLAAAGNKVVLVDADLRRPQVHKYLNLPNSTGVSTVLTRRSSLSAAIVLRPVAPRIATAGDLDSMDTIPSGASPLAVLPSGPVPPNAAEIIASKSFVRVIDELENTFDLVIVDTPALLSVGDTAAVAACVDGLIFLVDLARAKRPVLVDSATQISQMPCRKLGLVVISPYLSHDRYAYYSHHEPPVSVDVPSPSLKAVRP